MSKRRLFIGPAAMVAAAFIGPGTVTTASLAGAGYGFSLLWAVLFATLSTIILQEMAARLGVIGRMGLGEAIRHKITQPISFIFAAGLVISAILIGNAAYETGNITGALLGVPPLSLPLGEKSLNLWVIIMGAIAFALLYWGGYKWIEGFLIVLVGLMSVVFLTTAFLLQPPIGEILKGMFIPQFPKDSSFLILTLIGTTIVPYNLFLHASTSKEKWTSKEGIKEARRDTYFSVALGGLITICIVISAGMVLKGQDSQGLADLALQLEPLLGSAAPTVLGIGFFAAGLSSTLTAPLAAAYATSGILGWNSDTKDPKFRAVWMLVLFTGMFFALIGSKPIPVILFAQFANGLLLPIVAGFLLWVMNDENILGANKNRPITNILGWGILLIAIILGGKSIYTVISAI
ncbi:MAG: Nramp family divalent metal transporter [Bacteroidia bacterium]|nr:Nramp family divalent metal transporter [Bacteroidia bacterium]